MRLSTLITSSWGLVFAPTPVLCCRLIPSSRCFALAHGQACRESSAKKGSSFRFLHHRHAQQPSGLCRSRPRGCGPPSPRRAPGCCSRGCPATVEAGEGRGIWSRSSKPRRGCRVVARDVIGGGGRGHGIGVADQAPPDRGHDRGAVPAPGGLEVANLAEVRLDRPKHADLPVPIRTQITGMQASIGSNEHGHQAEAYQGACRTSTRSKVRQKLFSKQNKQNPLKGRVAAHPGRTVG